MERHLSLSPSFLLSPPHDTCPPLFKFLRHYIALVGLELTLETRLASNSQLASLS